MLDSGAFSFFGGKGDSICWEGYVDEYIDFINRNGVELFFELDIDSLIGYEKVKKLRRRIEDGTGRQCIPVWHVWRGKDEYFRMCDEYDYVAIGGIVSQDIPRRKYEQLFPWLINEAKKRGCKIHGLGYTSLSGLKKYHFSSVDSTAWLSGSRFGTVYFFDGRNLVKRKRKDNQRFSDSKKAAYNNFLQWSKFGNWAKENL